MKQNGFTLIEMIAVVILISLISLIFLPTITNQIANKKQKISEVAETLIFNATELYMSNRVTEYPKTAGNTYCVSLDKLVQSDYLSNPVKDMTTGKEIPLTNYVKITVNNYNEYEFVEITKEGC